MTPSHSGSTSDNEFVKGDKTLAASGDRFAAEGMVPARDGERMQVSPSVSRLRLSHPVGRYWEPLLLNRIER